jgi:poly(glycerol-phosphate) alpha-glucosyltransferase
MLDGWALRQSRLKKMLGAALFENSNLQSARCLHATAWAELEAIRHYGLKNPVCMVPNAVEIPKLDGKPWRNRGGGKAVLVYLGRFHRKKGLENLLQGWALARKKYGNRAENWRLRIAGGDQGKYHTKLQEIVDRIGVTESVELLAPKFGLEKRDFLENADGLILPSQSEGLPMIVIEAWAHSLPTLITRHCNLPEGALAGAAIEVGTDPESLCHGIASFMEMSPQQRNAMGESARRLAQTRFGGATVATAMKDVYMWAVGGSTCPTSVYLH